MGSHRGLLLHLLFTLTLALPLSAAAQTPYVDSNVAALPVFPTESVATLSGTGVTYPVSFAGETLELQIDGRDPVVTTLSGSLAAQDVADAINAAFALDSQAQPASIDMSGQLQLDGQRLVDGRIDVLSGAAAALVGLTVGDFAQSDSPFFASNCSRMTVDSMGNPITVNNDAFSDPSNGSLTYRDLIGDADDSAMFFYEDGTHIFFRMRLAASPVSQPGQCDPLPTRGDNPGTYLRPFGWSFQMDLDEDETTYEVAIVITDYISIYSNYDYTDPNDVDFPNKVPDNETFRFDGDGIIGTTVDTCRYTQVRDSGVLLCSDDTCTTTETSVLFTVAVAIEDILTAYNDVLAFRSL